MGRRRYDITRALRSRNARQVLNAFLEKPARVVEARARASILCNDDGDTISSGLFSNRVAYIRYSSA